MAHSFSQTLSRSLKHNFNSYALFPVAAKSPSNAARFLPPRSYSAPPEDADRVVAPTDDNVNTPEASLVDLEAMAVQKIEDAIHRIIVLKSVPDWLPLVPGGSYWVPPKRPLKGLPQLIHKIANPMTEEEHLSFSNVRGWPSSGFYASPAVRMPSSQMPQSEDEKSEID